jgi:hypothetical protein
VNEEPYVTVSIPASAALAEQKPIVTDEYAQFVEEVKNDITNLMWNGRFLRADAERFVVWCRDMGEGVPNAAAWGKIQMESAYAWRTNTRAAVEKWKADIVSESRSVEQIIFLVFKEPSLHPEITQQARTELGL